MENFTTIAPKEPNGKSVKLHANLCTNCGFGNKKRAVEEICHDLSNEGIEVHLKINKIKGDTGIQEVIVEHKGGDEIIYSNRKDVVNAIITEKPLNVKAEILEKIKKTLG